ncbi:MAG: dihydrofolate reductase family protein [Bacteroidia bacterium]|nr:dihydrofolate reductase family protein [Bacteroidia bacterium]
MRKVILYIAMSLDGYIAREDGSIDWLPAVDEAGEDYGYGEFIADIDTVLMGRITYEQILTFGAYPYAGMQGIVFSRSRAGEIGEHVRFTDENPGEVLHALRLEEGKDIWLVGGGALISAFLDGGLINEYCIFIVPVLLGRGITLFDGPFPETSLTLRDTKHYSSGMVRLRYGAASA